MSQGGQRIGAGRKRLDPLNAKRERKVYYLTPSETEQMDLALETIRSHPPQWNFFPNDPLVVVRQSEIKE